MSIRTSLRAWDEAQSLFDNSDLPGALGKLEDISESQKTARIYFNIGGIHLLLSNTDSALANLNRCIEKDPHLAVAYYHRGVVYFKLARFSDALTNFEGCHTRLRENKMIDYKQLGLRFKLYSCEVLYNIACTHVQLGDHSRALTYLQSAERCKVEAKHKCILSAIEQVQRKQSFPLLEQKQDSVFFRPAKTKTANLGKKDYLGKAKVVASVEANDNFSGFVGPKLLEAGQLNTASKSLPNSPMATRRAGVTKAASEPRPRTPPSGLTKTASEPRPKTPPSRSLNLQNLQNALAKKMQIGDSKPVRPVRQRSQTPPSIVISTDAPDAPPPRPPKNKTALVNQPAEKPQPLLPRPAKSPLPTNGDTGAEMKPRPKARSPVPKARSPAPKMLTVIVECLGNHTFKVNSHVTLRDLETLVNEELEYEAGTVALWFHPSDNEPYMVDNDEGLHRLFRGSRDGRLSLSAYSRS